MTIFFLEKCLQTLLQITGFPWRIIWYCCWRENCWCYQRQSIWGQDNEELWLLSDLS